MSRYMVLASSKDAHGNKIGYRIFTNKLNTDKSKLEKELDGTDVKIVVYKALYGDIDTSFRVPNTLLYSDLSAFRDAIKC